MNSPISPETVRIPLDRDLFLRKLLRELTGLLEDVVGTDEACGYISSVGSAMGAWIDEQYRTALDVDTLGIEQIAQVFVDLKGRIGGDFYVVDLAQGGDAVRHFRIDESEHPVEYDSLKDMVATLAEAFDRGVFVVEEGYLEMDDSALGDLAAELNPSVIWWRD